MKTKISHFFWAVLTIFSCTSMAVDDERKAVEEQLEQAIGDLQEAYNQWSQAGFEEAIQAFDRIAKQNGDQALALYWKGTGLFFLSLHHLYSRGREPDSAAGKRTVKEGIKTLSRSIDKNPDFSESYALRGVLRGMLISINPWSAATQGKKVGKDRQRALELNPNNPRVHYLTGVSLWNAPKLLGAKDQAIDHLLEADKGFALEKSKDLSPVSPRWGHSTCLAFIGDVFADQGEGERARTYYLKALDVNPDDPLAKRGLDHLKQGE